MIILHPGSGDRLSETEMALFVESYTGPRNLHVTLCLFLVVLLGSITLLVKLLCVLPGVPSLPQNVLNRFLSDTDLKKKKKKKNNSA